MIEYRSIHPTKILFFLHYIRIYVNYQTTVQPLYKIIIHTIFSSFSDPPLITIKGQVIKIIISRITYTHSGIKRLFDRTNIQHFYDIIC